MNSPSSGQHTAHYSPVIIAPFVAWGRRGSLPLFFWSGGREGSPIAARTASAGDLAGALAFRFRPLELARDLSIKPRILLQSEQEMHAVRFAPGHHLLPRKAAVATQQDAHLRPAAADLRNYACNLLYRAGGCIRAPGPQLGRQPVAGAN